MRRKPLKKLSLNRETLRLLKEGDLDNVVAAAFQTQRRTICPDTCTGTEPPLICGC